MWTPSIATGLAATVVVACGISASGQAPPTPSAEHQRLQFLVGKWHTEGNDKPSAYGPGGKQTADITCEWFDGHFQVICRSNANLPSGPLVQMEIYSYSPTEHLYHRYNLDNTGNAALASAEIQGKVWRWHGTAKEGPKQVRFDFPMTETSPDSYSVTVAVTVNGGKPAVITEATAHRVQ